MLECAMNNGAIRDIGPLLPLTNNLIYRRYDAMAESSVAQTRVRKQRRRIPINTGERFGRLVVIEESISVSPSGHYRRSAKCQCDCGNITNPVLSDLWSGDTQSCGCLMRETTGNIRKTHGLSKHPLHGMWKRMRSRCLNANSKDYPDYGGRGIAIHKEWLNNFKAFYDWAIDKWSPGLIIDRENVNQEYSPENCRFVDNGLSSRNTRLLRRDNTSGFRGVWLCKNGKWTANIKCNNEQIHLGRFTNPIDAAKAYDAKAKELDSGHPLNFPGE